MVRSTFIQGFCAQLEDLEQANSDLEDANTQLEAKVLQTSRQRDELQKQLQTSAAGNQEEAGQMQVQLREQQQAQERLTAQVQKLEAACNTLKVCMLGA